VKGGAAAFSTIQTGRGFLAEALWRRVQA